MISVFWVQTGTTCITVTLVSAVALWCLSSPWTQAWASCASCTDKDGMGSDEGPSDKDELMAQTIVAAPLVLGQSMTWRLFMHGCRGRSYR